MNSKIKEIESIFGNKGKGNVKIEKKEKGLYEKTEDNNSILLTEDNKMMLND